MVTYKLGCSLHGHSKDVRAVCAAEYPPGAIVSGSRDLTSRIWIPNEYDRGFVEGNVMGGHNGFVHAVCALPGNETHPLGLIATASLDKCINIYSLDSPSPLHRLQGHTDAVCSLAANSDGLILSGSWDKTAKVWIDTINTLTLQGHQSAVWCVALMPNNDYMITGSADKTIKVWRDNQCQHTLQGHEDCVRGLSVINEKEFLSCSNDSSVRRWTVTGHVLQVYFGHMNFVYAVATMPNGLGFVSVGEDRTLRIWRAGECSQVLTHPCVSVWSVCVLSNGDIVTGSSDGIVRVFTTDPARMASPDELLSFDDQVASSQIPTQVGDMDVDKLPGPEVLSQPGKKDGATVMVRQGTAVEAHQWSDKDGKWIKVGDVVGASSGSSGKRTLFEGREYDFVFTIDVEEGKPPLKLPYNMTEDPWFAAQRFITKHGVSQVYLDQIHDFIVENSQSVSLTQLPSDQSYRDPFTGGSSYVPGSRPSEVGSFSDPFTGAGRYVPPSSSNGTASKAIPLQGADPFTGSGSYRPAEALNTAHQINSYFPVKDYVLFNTINPETVVNKLVEFNRQLPGSLRCEEGDLKAMARLCDITEDPVVPMLTYLWRILNWPDEKSFPAVDILRLALLNKTVNAYFCGAKLGQGLIDFLKMKLQPNSALQTQTVALRAIANMVVHPDSRQLLLSNLGSIIQAVTDILVSSNRNIQVAATTIFLNIAIIRRSDDNVESKFEVMSGLATAASTVTDHEARFRVCAGLGTLITGDKTSADMAKALNLDEDITVWKEDKECSKLRDAAGLLNNLLKV